MKCLPLGGATYVTAIQKQYVLSFPSTLSHFGYYLASSNVAIGDVILYCRYIHTLINICLPVGIKQKGIQDSGGGRYIAICELFDLRRGEPTIMEFIERNE